ncbi:fumarylacetoacetate hydrolase family protein [Nocardia sp. NBC_00508]|uniref:fumarylacetoacetate hydrolase family protein n=1 Tax=Nocardia sp. NBC_00508 TaxID=2975992 RepID=UPI002E8203C4|nr:fumarylacetoacetate hydrolase family protein [Nocardia sp. NBC_00508]WUD64778.1 fumarylacetoacetate hydrolase family protein [Nocardia sp. NBC_00508]
MRDNDPANHIGLARATVRGERVMVFRRSGAASAFLAMVDDQTYADLPELLEAVGGNPDRIRRGPSVTVPDDDLLSPVGNPRKIICVGQNYLAHITETGRDQRPAYPDLFAKWATALCAPYADIPLPPESDQVDYESELAIVIGKRCRRIPEAQAATVVFGYTAANDGSVRDFQFHTAQRTAGKAWDALTPLGPVVVPAAHLGGARPDLRLTGRLNGERVQDDRTTNLLFGIPQLVAYITTFMTLEPGDVILTGTPAGVGLAQTPPRYLTDGDEFEVRIEGIGAIRNRCVREHTR